jgi:Flp pilus assembly protein TadB
VHRKSIGRRGPPNMLKMPLTSEQSEALYFQVHSAELWAVEAADPYDAKDQRMKWVGGGAAFRAGMVVAPSIFWTLVIVAGMVVLGTTTHLWILPLLAVVIVIATVVAFVQAWRERECRRAFRRTHTWAEVHREEEHLLRGADQYCTICRLLTRNLSTKENGDRLRF